MEREHQNKDLSGSTERTSGKSPITLQLKILIIFDEKLNVIIETITNENTEKEETNPSSENKLLFQIITNTNLCVTSCFNEFEMRKIEETITDSANLFFTGIFPKFTERLEKENKLIFEVISKKDTRQKSIETLKSFEPFNEEKEREIQLFLEQLESFAKQRMEENIKTFEMQKAKQYEKVKISKRNKICQMNEEKEEEMKKKGEERVSMEQEKQENDGGMKKKLEVRFEKKPTEKIRKNINQLTRKELSCILSYLLNDRNEMLKFLEVSKKCQESVHYVRTNFVPLSTSLTDEKLQYFSNMETLNYYYGMGSLEHVNGLFPKCICWEPMTVDEIKKKVMKKQSQKEGNEEGMRNHKTEWEFKNVYLTASDLNIDIMEYTAEIGEKIETLSIKYPLEIKEKFTIIREYCFTNMNLNLLMMKDRNQQEKIKFSSELIIPSNIHTIDKLAFSHCYLFTKISVPEETISIGKRAFEHCYPLRELEIKGNLKHMGGLVIEGCTSLTSLSIPKWSVTGDRAFSSGPTLQSIKLRTQVKMFNGEKVKLEPLKTYTIAEWIYAIGDYCFANAYQLREVKGMRRDIRIGKECFKNCRQLEMKEMLLMEVEE